MSLRGELSASPTLRFGLSVIGVILAWYAVDEWHAHQLSLAESFRRVSGQVKRYASPQSMAQWPQRESDARTLAQHYERRLWRQRSYGLAQAELQDWLRRQLQAVNAQGVSIKIGDAPASADRIAAGATGDVPQSESAPVRVSAQIEFASPDPQVLLALLAGFAGEERQLIVDSLVAKAQRYDIRVSAWYQLGAAAARTP